MNIRNMYAVASAAAVCFATGAASAQAPSSAQVWEARFDVDGAGEGATVIGITFRSRMAILPNTSASGTTNLGVSRMGGNHDVFFMRAIDPIAELRTQHRFGRGLTGEVNGAGELILDQLGAPIEGLFSLYRVPARSNNDIDNNGDFGVDILGRAFVTGVVGGRVGAFDGVTPGAATIDTGGALVGEYATTYRLLYFPAPGPARDISFSVTGLTAR